MVHEPAVLIQLLSCRVERGPAELQQAALTVQEFLLVEPNSLQRHGVFQCLLRCFRPSRSWPHSCHHVKQVVPHADPSTS